MFSSLKIFLIPLLVSLLISSCATKSNINKENEKQETEVEKNIRLTNEILSEKYVRYADILAKNGEGKSSKYFRELSQKALKGDYGAKFKRSFSNNNKPHKLADAYFLFNCWYYFETSGENLGEATICKNSFLDLYQSLEQESKQLEEKNIVAENNKPNELIVDIYFDYDSFKLNNEATEKLGELLKYINSLETDYRILLIGHTDRIGKPIYNNTLARRRANTVLNTLVKNGVPFDLIDVKSFGSRYPSIITKKDKKNQENRRVEIVVSRGYKSPQDFLPQPTLK